MKKFINISCAVAAFLVTTTTSCKKQLDEDNPHSATDANMYNTPSGFVSLVNMAYQDLHEFYGIEDGYFLGETGTDLWFNAARGTYAKQITQYDGLVSTQGQTKNAWTFAYRGINYCNTGIAGIDKAGFTNETDKNQRLGELRFLRALYYFHVVEQFGNVVLRTAPSSEGVDVNDTRSAPEDFYDLMINDLQFAKDNLPVSWPVTDYSRASKKSAMGLLARVLLTRAYYSTGADAQAWFTKARDAAVEVINSQSTLGISLYSTYDQIGTSVYGSNRQNNKEAMFVLAYNEATPALNAYTSTNGDRIFKYGLTKYTGRPGMSSTIVNAYGVDNEPRMMPTWHLLDLYDETIDARYKANFQEVWTANSAYTWKIGDTSSTTYERDPTVVGKTLAVGDTAMWCTKGVLPYDRKTHRFIAAGRNDLYVNPVHGLGANIVNSTVVTNYYPSFKKWVNPARTATANTDYGDALIIRLGEMYLIAAEAALQLGDKATAAQYINVIRTRAALPGQQAAMQITASDVDINFILDERGREFVGELQRWYDLKRIFRGYDLVTYITKYNPDITLMFSFHRLRPIPQSELDAILNAADFGQNTGY